MALKELTLLDGNKISVNTDQICTMSVTGPTGSEVYSICMSNGSRLQTTTDPS